MKMFKRVGKYLTFIVKDIMALEEVSKWICEVVGKPYFIEVETFPNTQIYHVNIKSDEIEDEAIVNLLKKISESSLKQIKIEGYVTIKNNETQKMFLNKFVKFLDSNGWWFGGGTREHIDGEAGEVIITLPDEDGELKPVSTDELVEQGFDINKIDFEDLSREKQPLI